MTDMSNDPDSDSFFENLHYFSSAESDEDPNALGSENSLRSDTELLNRNLANLSVNSAKNGLGIS